MLSDAYAVCTGKSRPGEDGGKQRSLGILPELTHMGRNTSKMPASSLSPKAHLPGAGDGDVRLLRKAQIPVGVVGEEAVVRAKAIRPPACPPATPGRCPSPPDVPSGSMERVPSPGGWGTQPPTGAAPGGSPGLAAVDPPRAGTEPGVLQGSCPVVPQPQEKGGQSRPPVEPHGGSLGPGHPLSVGTGLWRSHHVPPPSEPQNPG